MMVTTSYGVSNSNHYAYFVGDVQQENHDP